MAEIQIQWLGHSCFRVECQGYAIVLDPFEPGSVPGLRDIQQTADQVLCSHEHHDHNYRAGVALREKGAENPFAITAFPSFHDDCGGEKRGPNTIHLLEAGGLRVAHMGDAGCMPSPEILERLQELDAVMLPVGPITPWARKRPRPLWRPSIPGWSFPCTTGRTGLGSTCWRRWKNSWI